MSCVSKILVCLEWWCKLRTQVVTLGRTTLTSKLQVEALVSSMGARSSGEHLPVLGGQDMVGSWLQDGAKLAAGNFHQLSANHASGSLITWVIIQELRHTFVLHALQRLCRGANANVMMIPKDLLRRSRSHNHGHGQLLSGLVQGLVQAHHNQGQVQGPPQPHGVGDAR